MVTNKWLLEGKFCKILEATMKSQHKQNEID